MKHATIKICSTGMAVVLVVKRRSGGVAHLDAPAQQYVEMAASRAQKHAMMVISLLWMGAVHNASLKMDGTALFQMYSALQYVATGECVARNNATTGIQIAATGVTSVWCSSDGHAYPTTTWSLPYARQCVVTGNCGEQKNATMAMLPTVTDAPLPAILNADTSVR